jgi:predicted metal-dependent phosphoesterase TrpH
MSFLIDTHVHTKETSPCGRVPAAEAARLYSAAGYAGVIVTDHFTDDVFEAFTETSWPAKVRRWFAGFRTFHDTAAPLGLTAFPGMEIRFRNTVNDYLVFGVTEDLLASEPCLYDRDLAYLRGFADRSGLLVYQAHPFRMAMSRAEPRLLDGIETWNGNSSHDSANDRADRWADENGLRKISGSDFHHPEHIRGGLKTDRLPADWAGLRRILLEQDYSLLRND